MTQNPLRDLSEKYGLDTSNLLHALVDDLPDQVYVKDTEGRYLFNNAKHVEALGAVSSEEVAGKSDFDFYPKELAERYRADEEEVVKSGQPLVCREEPSVDEDGNKTWHLSMKVPLRNGSGEIVGLVGMTRDVTERKRAEEKLRESEERYRTVVEQSMEGIWLFDPDTKQVLESNAAFQEMLGYSTEELQEMTNYDFVAHSREDIDSAVQHILQERRGYFGERKYRRKDGVVLDVEVSGTVIPYQGKEAVCAVARDLTERKQAEEALKESEERFRSAFEDAPIGVALVDLDRSHLRVNRAFCEMLGYSEEELLEKSHSEIVHPDDREKSTDRIHEILEEGAEPYALERRYLHADGRVVWSLSNISLVRDSRGEPSHFVCLHQDITERKELEERLRHQAFYDSLTELPNRALFLDRLEHALARTRRLGGPVAVLFVDLNHFKLINDSLGHDAGNAVLVEVAERLQSSVRPGDTVGRIFGDEFVVLLEAPSGTEEAKRAAERIQERLQAPFNVNGREVFVGPSIGIALGESAEDEPEEVLRHADLAMYEAKSRGEAYYEVYDASMDTRLQKRMDLESDLRRAIEREELEVHYQPKVLLETGEIVGMEALVRWKHPDRGLLPAAQFIPLAEETGLIDQIGEWVLKESCRQIKEWHERYSAKPGSPFDLCVNISAREIQQPDLAEEITAVLRETELDPHCLVLEISEGTAMKDTESTIGKLRKLKDLGIKLALDDFGTGYCSLVYLEHSLFDILKIDRQLIYRGREDVEKCAAITSAMIDMAHSLGLEAIVEGVETEEQLAKLKEMGCEIAQGYYFAEPLPAEAIERLLVEVVS